jgi:hypothetical protein
MLPALTMSTIPKSFAFPFVFRSTRFVPAVIDTVPALIAPDCVIVPPELTVSVPLSVDAPNTIAVVSTSVTLFALVTTTVPKAFDASVRLVRLFVPMAIVSVPGIATTYVFGQLTAPAVVPPVVFTLTFCTSFPPPFENAASVTAPPVAPVVDVSNVSV